MEDIKTNNTNGDNKPKVIQLNYSTGGIGHTKESLSEIVKDSYSSLAPLINMQKRLAEVKKQVAAEKSKNEK